MKAKSIFQYVLGAMIALGFFVLIGLLLYKTVPEGNKDILNLVVGALIGSFTAIVGYFFGSSLGSSEKTDIISKLPPIQ
jgi:drug/metabolite transporter (DMT)-like permease